MPNQLITITTSEQGSLVVSSLDFSAGLAIKHKNLLETIRKHREVIERDFGLIAFKTEPVKRPGERGTKYQSVAYLTEDQSLFIGTLSRNSTRVIEFKSILVQSFAEARKRLISPTLTTQEALIQLVSQQTQLLAENQQMIARLRSDVDRLITARPKDNRQKQPETGRQLTLPCTQSIRRIVSDGRTRSAIHTQVAQYCNHYNASHQDTYKYLYKRLFDIYSINVHRLIRQEGESLLDAVERYGHLDQLYSLALAELIHTED